MDNLDLLITKFKEVKEELQKSDSPLHDTVEGFMGGLKALPKGSAERGKFITTHMSHGPFIGALNAHPQGKQLHGMLMGHLDSKANAGPKAFAGAQVKVQKSMDEDLDDFMEKAYVSPFYTHGPSKPIAKPAAVAPSKKLTGLDRIRATSQEKIQPTTIISEDRNRAAAMGAPSNPTSPAKTKLTGLDRIRAESQKPITATTVKKDEETEKAEGDLCSKCRVNKVTSATAPTCNSCRVAAAQDKMKTRGTPVEKPAAHPPVKKGEDVEKSTVGDMKGGGRSTLTSPKDMSRANAFHEAMSGAFQPKPVVAVPAKKLTGMDRIKALSSQPIQKDEEVTRVRPTNKLATGAKPESGHGYGASGYNTTIPLPKIKPAGMGLHTVGGPTNSLASQPPSTGEKTVAHRLPRPLIAKTEASPKFEKTINSSYAPQTNMAMSCSEKLTLNKGGQWGLTISKPSGPISKPSGTISTPSGPISKPTVIKDETGMPGDTVAKGECPKCHADPCECQTTGVLVDKMDTGGYGSN